jgi:SpoVK/Ycf46/Vps4 family AAA+-type ATPase
VLEKDSRHNLLVLSYIPKFSTRFSWKFALERVDNMANTSSLIPGWFYVHNLQPASELLAQKTYLEIIDDSPALTEVGSPDGGTYDQDFDQHDFGLGQPTRWSARPPAKYQIRQSTYAPLRALCQLQSPDETSSDFGPGRLGFKSDAVLLDFPHMHGTSSGLRLLSAIVQHFAQAATADLLTLDVEDLNDLQQHILRSKTSNHWKNGDIEQYAQELHSASSDDVPYAELLSQAGAHSQGTPMESETIPLVIHLREACDITETHGLDCLRAIKQAISEIRRSASTIIIMTTLRQSRYAISGFAPPACACGSCEGRLPKQVLTEFGKAVLHAKDKDEPLAYANFDTHDKSALLRAVGSFPHTEPIYVAEVQSNRSAVSLDTHGCDDEPFFDYNVRGLKRWLRHRSDEYHEHLLLQPYVEWQFLNGSALRRDWAQHPKDHGKIAGRILDTLSDQDLSNSILKAGHLPMYGARDDQSAAATRVESRHATAENKRRIERQCNSVERGLLDCVVISEDCDEGWDEIAIDQDVKDTLLRTLSLGNRQDIASYGILKKTSTKGVLLYGPPGTGKTHLARVLALESQMFLLSVSAADLMSKWYSETEQNVQGLFSLARKMSPAIIFIDEADSIFMRRASSSSESNTTRLVTNQLLQEMDGIRRSPSSPFMLLATNIPGDLDYAIHRRIPHRVYMGLPTPELRADLLRILLKDEVLDAAVDLEHVAQLSSGYTGSDLKTACIQTAQACNVCVGPRDRRRLLKRSHFETGLQMTSPSVSPSSLEKIKAFAAQYDPGALAKIKKDVASLTTVASAKSRNQHVEDEAANRHEFHRPDFEEHRPDLHNVDLASLPLDYGLAHMDESGSETVHGGDHTQVRLTDAPLAYQPLKANSKQIRVLSISPTSRNLIEDVVEAPNCIMKTVSLEDWTESYHAFLNWMELQHLPSTPKYCHALWALRGAYSYAASQGGAAHESDLIDWTESRLSNDNDWRLRSEDPACHRFSWGDYIALSYVWGDAKQRKDIVVNGHTLSVTANLYDALINLRESEEISRRKLHVWIDAICINQQDLDERACEVQKMSMIYSECLAVRGWLGCPGSATEAATIVKIRKFLDETAHVEAKKCTWEMAGSFIDKRDLLHAANTLLTPSYWERLWIVQEMALAPSLHFKFGQEQFMTLDLLRLAGWCFSQPLSLMSSPDLSRPAVRLQRLRHWTEFVNQSPGHFSTIVEIARLTRASQATDPRDKLYGMLALLPHDIAKCVKPDYKASSDEATIFVKFSRDIYQAERSLDILARGGNVVKRPGMPTWALDLARNTEQEEPHGITMDKARHRRYRANHGLTKLPFNFKESGRLLCCQGVIVDTVQTVQSLSTSTDDFQSSTQSIQKQSSAYADPASALCCVLMNDEDLKLRAGDASILDIPWMSSVSSKVCTEIPGDSQVSPGEQHEIHSTEPVAWHELYRRTGFASIFYSHLAPNGDFDIAGQPLKSYFKPENDSGMCCDPVAYRAILFVVGANLLRDRIFTTTGGRTGTAPRTTRPGDKVVILCNCDKPMVLRQFDQSYQVVGSCFVDGLMKGETVGLTGNAEGLCMQEFVLC